MRRSVWILAVLATIWLNCIPCSAGFNPADIDSDGIVDLPDFARLAAGWMSVAADPCADIDHRSQTAFTLGA